MPYEIAIEEWRAMSWWPEGREASIYAGLTGHEGEIVVNIDGYDWDKPIPWGVVEVFEELLPETWKVESRGTRIEVHPAGHYNGGWDAFDVNAVTDVLREMGLRVEKISMETGIS
jgi:hypothetical protein